MKDVPVESEHPKPVFSITPHRLEMNPGDSVDVVLEGTSDMLVLVCFQHRLKCTIEPSDMVQ